MEHCAICHTDRLDTERNYTVTECGHEFHTSCLLKWVVSNAKHTCPICRHLLAEPAHSDENLTILGAQHMIDTLQALRANLHAEVQQLVRPDFLEPGERMPIRRPPRPAAPPTRSNSGMESFGFDEDVHWGLVPVASNRDVAHESDSDEVIFLN